MRGRPVSPIGRSELKRVLFVCTGNSCRSPMAEALFEARKPAAWGGDVVGSSAGTAAWEGQPAAHLAVEVLHGEGIDLSDHRSRMLTKTMLEEADVIVVMEGHHRDVIERIASEAAARVIVFGTLDDARENPDIEDPIGGDRTVYERAKRELEGLVDHLIGYLAELYGLPR